MIKLDFFKTEKFLKKKILYRVDLVHIFVGSNKRHSGSMLALDVQRDIINHENFDPTTGANDISLIKTPQPILFDGKYFKVKFSSYEPSLYRLCR